MNSYTNVWNMRENVKQYNAYLRGDIKLPGHLQIKKEEAASLFKNKTMEWLSRTHIFVPVIMHFIIACTFITLSYLLTDLNGFLIPTLVAAGVLSWSFAEYWVHRIVYHTETNSKTLFGIQHNAHGFHHQYPRDKYRLAMPPIPSILLAASFFGIFYLFMGTFAMAFFPGFLFGYIAYISLHYAQHRIQTPSYPPFRKLWKHHAIHHYKNPYSAYGVTSRLWDWVFGTTPEEMKSKKAVVSK